MYSKESLEKIITALMIAAVTWLFIKAVKVDPVEQAVIRVERSVDKLSDVLVLINKQGADRQVDNSNEHGELAMMINKQNAMIAGERVKLFRVIEDCKEQGVILSRCHSKQITIKRN